MVSDHGLKEVNMMVVSGLNPCCNGRWSLTVKTAALVKAPHCLNSCFNGRWSLTKVTHMTEFIATWKS